MTLLYNIVWWTLHLDINDILGRRAQNVLSDDGWRGGRLITDSSRLTLSSEDPPRPPRGCEYLSGKSPSQRTARVQGVGITLYFVTLLWFGLQGGGEYSPRVLTAGLASASALTQSQKSANRGTRGQRTTGEMEPGPPPRGGEPFPAIPPQKTATPPWHQGWADPTGNRVQIINSYSEYFLLEFKIKLITNRLYDISSLRSSTVENGDLNNQ